MLRCVLNAAETMKLRRSLFNISLPALVMQNRKKEPTFLQVLLFVTVYLIFWGDLSVYYLRCRSGCSKKHHSMACVVEDAWLTPIRFHPLELILLLSMTFLLGLHISTVEVTWINEFCKLIALDINKGVCRKCFKFLRIAMIELWRFNIYQELLF